MKALPALCAMSVAFLVSTAHADVIVSTGGPSGNYHQFFVDLKKVCGGEVELVELPSTGSDKNLENLLTKQADLAVGGQPLGCPKSLDASDRLLRIDKATAGQMAFYVPATLSYGNLNASAVPTIAAQAYLVTRNFRGAVKKAELSKIRACIVANLEELVEGRGYSPKWKEVKPEAPTIWARYETLPAPAPR